MHRRRFQFSWPAAFAVGVVVMVLGALTVFSQMSMQPRAVADPQPGAGYVVDDFRLACEQQLAQQPGDVNVTAWLQNCQKAMSATGTPSPSPSTTEVSPSPTPTQSPSTTPTPTASTIPPSPSPSTTGGTPPLPSSSPTPSSSTSPQPSPTTSGPVVNCLPVPSRCGYPDASNTGPSGSLSVIQGNVTITTTGVFENKEVRGCMEVRANNVTIRNVRVVGNDCFYGIRNYNSGLRIEDSEIQCGGNGTGVTSNNYTVLRTDISRCENGFNVSGNVSVSDSWVHDMEACCGAHTDGAQFNQGAANIVFSHNTMVVPAPGGTSAIIMWDEGNPQNSNVLLNDNILAGGTYTLYCPRMNSTNVRVTNNRFGPHEYGSTNSCAAGHVAQFSGNVNDIDNSPVSP